MERRGGGDRNRKPGRTGVGVRRGIGGRTDGDGASGSDVIGYVTMGSSQRFVRARAATNLPIERPDAIRLK